MRVFNEDPCNMKAAYKFLALLHWNVYNKIYDEHKSSPELDLYFMFRLHVFMCRDVALNHFDVLALIIDLKLCIFVLLSCILIVLGILLEIQPLTAVMVICLLLYCECSIRSPLLSDYITTCSLKLN